LHLKVDQITEHVPFIYNYVSLTDSLIHTHEDGEVLVDPETIDHGFVCLIPILETYSVQRFRRKELLYLRRNITFAANVSNDLHLASTCKNQ